MAVANLLHKEMTRKEFLSVVGLAALSIFGLGTFIKLLTGKSLETNHILNGYGGSVYGGSGSSDKARL